MIGVREPFEECRDPDIPESLTPHDRRPQQAPGTETPMNDFLNRPVTHRPRSALSALSGFSAHTTAHRGYASVLSALGRTA